MSPSVRREPTPDFLRSRRRARDPRFLQLLTFGMLLDPAAFTRAVDWAEACRSTWGTQDLTHDELSWLLKQVVGDAIQRCGPRPVTLGLSAGYDSRPMLWALWELGLQPQTYTFGQVGNLDFDLVKLLADRLALETEFIDSNTADWPLEQFDWYAQSAQDLPISPRVLAERHLDDLVPGRIDVHGYLNDALTGGTRPRGPVDSHQLAITEFVNKNDFFGFQQLMPEGLVERLLPSELVDPDRPLSSYQQLDIGYRQAQRIRPVTAGSHTFAFPFEDPRWVGYWLTRPEPEIAGQRSWLRFVRHLGGALLFDLEPFEALPRKDLRRRRLGLVYGGQGQTGLVDVTSSQRILPANPTQHFDLRACYRNNHSFQDLVGSSIRRLRGRRIFVTSFIDDVMSRFREGEDEAAKMMNGLLTADIAIEAGRI